MSDELCIEGTVARTIIINCHALMRMKYRGLPLWSMVRHITGHGSGKSAEICRSANLDPHQECGLKTLKDLKP